VIILSLLLHKAVITVATNEKTTGMKPLVILSWG